MTACAASGAFNQVVCAGTPFEMGLAHGQQAASLVRASIEAYKQIFVDLAGFKWDEVLRKAAVFEPKLQETVPDLIKEMQGIAQGAGVDFMSILALNVRSEISLANPLDGCTSFSKISAGKQFICQNWDWKTAITNAIVILHLKPSDGSPQIKIVTEAGIIGKIGLNSSGVSIVMNAIKAPTLDVALIPIHLLMRRLLSKRSLVECKAYLATLAGAASSVHLMLADGQSAWSVEAAPQGFQFLLPNDQTELYHTNHLLSSELKKATGEGPWLADSQPRIERIAQLVGSGTKLSHETNRAYLADRTLGRHGICRHEGGTGIDTLFSISMNSTDREAEVIRGRPDEEGPISVLSFA